MSQKSTKPATVRRDESANGGDARSAPNPTESHQPPSGDETHTKVMDPADSASRRSLSMRAWLRLLHRDAGYLAIGLTFVYAVSGLAVNHIADWDPNFEQFEREHQLHVPLEGEDRQIARSVLLALGIDETVRDVFRASQTQLEITLEHRTIHVDPTTGKVDEEGQRPRALLRVANWLHLNRGKKAWSYVADSYAMLLLFLACSGMFMLSGRRGIFGRGGLLVATGLLLPVLYVVLSGGP